MALRREGWEGAVQWLGTLPGLSELAWDYLTVIDRTDRASETVIGRYDRNRGHDLYLGPEDLASWLTEIIEGNCLGQPRTVLRLRTWLAKGTGTAAAGTRQIVVFDDGAMDLETTSVAEAEARATVVALKDVGGYYSELMRLALGAFDRMTKALGDQANSAQVSLLSARAELERMHHRVISEHRTLSETDAMVRIHEADAQVRGKAVERISDKIGGLVDGVVRGLTGTKVDPALAPVLDRLGESAELRAALASPGLRRLLADPESRDILLSSLADQLSRLGKAGEEDASNGAGDPEFDAPESSES